MNVGDVNNTTQSEMPEVNAEQPYPCEVIRESPNICRICHESQEESKEEFISPCNCQGSLKYVHASCMDTWRLMNMENRNKSTCQLCMTDFRLVRSSKLARHTFVSHKRLYKVIIRSLSILSLVPLSFGALSISAMLKHDEMYNSSPTNVHARPWKKEAFGSLLSDNTLAQVNLYIAGASPKAVSRMALFLYGLTKLGSYGCTLWLFTDGLGDFFPTRVVYPSGERRPYPLLAVFKAVLEFYLVPLCLQTPQTKSRLPWFLSSISIGLAFVISRVERKLRVLLLGLLPFCKQLELGTLAKS